MMKLNSPLPWPKTLRIGGEGWKIFLSRINRDKIKILISWNRFTSNQRA